MTPDQLELLKQNWKIRWNRRLRLWTGLFSIVFKINFIYLQSDSIRTIIKARGLSFPNITGKTFAVFRVDWIHHLVSFISMISPSPDWFVGIHNLELCQEDCTWVESKIIDLYPWDAGTNNGKTYDVNYNWPFFFSFCKINWK